MINFDYLKGLNSAQKEAVINTDGPVLVVAGLVQEKLEY